MALFALLPMFFAIPAGRLADRVGVRGPMLAGSIGMASGVLIATLLPGLPALFATAMLTGVSFMLFQVAAQYATGEMGGRAARSRNFGLLALGYSTSSIAGPLIAGLMIDHAGYRATFALLTLLPLLPIAVLATNRIALPGPHPAHARHPNAQRARLRHPPGNSPRLHHQRAHFDGVGAAHAVRADLRPRDRPFGVAHRPHPRCVRRRDVHRAPRDACDRAARVRARRADVGALRRRDRLSRAARSRATPAR